METLKMSRVKPNPDNPRLIKDDKFKKLIASITQSPSFMILRPVILDETLMILGGNMRYKACKESIKIFTQKQADENNKRRKTEGLKEATYIEQCREFIIKDNIGFGEHDWDILANEWDAKELEEWGLEGFPFEDEVLEAEEDDYTEPDKMQVDVVLGDLIEIGEHRLLCGDSTDSDQVAKLMNGEKADMVFTDPPYGNGSSGKYGRGQLGVRTILNDETFKVVDDFFNLRVCQSYVFFLQWRTFKEAIQTLENNNLKLKTIAVWDKKNAGLNGAGGMSEQWEAIIVAGDIKYSRFGGNVFNVSREQKKRIDSPHPHQKPIQLLSDVLEYFQDYKNLLDPFSGSGSTMVAAHQLKRKCYGMELDPKYCQVIIDRMIKLDESLEVKINGERYEQN
jgi:DNA modification methylase